MKTCGNAQKFKLEKSYIKLYSIYTFLFIILYMHVVVIYKYKYMTYIKISTMDIRVKDLLQMSLWK